MIKYKFIKVSPEMFFLIRAMKFLTSNDEARDISDIEASRILCNNFLDFASWDITRGKRITAEYRKVKVNSS